MTSKGTRLIAASFAFPPSNSRNCGTSCLELDTAHWLSEGHSMMEQCQSTALTKAVQSRLAALVKELQRRADAEAGDSADE